jgi:hypothetical protein
MDELTDRQRAIPGHHIPFRDIYRGPLAIAFATSIAAVSGATLLYPVLPVIAADPAVDEAQIRRSRVGYDRLHRVVLVLCFIDQSLASAPFNAPIANAFHNHETL